MGSDKRKGTRTQSEIGLDSMATRKQSPGVGEDSGWDIQVVTDIQVEVEGANGKLSVWPSPTRSGFKESERGEKSQGAWLDDASAKDMRKPSTESLV